MLSKKFNILLIAAIIVIIALICLTKQYVYIDGQTYLAHCHKIELNGHYSKCRNLENLKNFDQLDEISVSYFSQKDMDKLASIFKENNKFEKLKTLNIRLCGAADLSFLNYLPNLEKVHILETEIDLCNITKNENLKALEIINCNIICPKSLNLFDNLENIYISINREVDISNFSNLQNLKTMELTTIDTIANIEKLSSLKALESITIRNVNNLDIEYSVFDPMLNLKRIEVTENIISDDVMRSLDNKGVSVTAIPDDRKSH